MEYYRAPFTGARYGGKINRFSGMARVPVAVLAVLVARRIFA
jgi:hypothetical protein